jgi:hypothetical protein
MKRILFVLVVSAVPALAVAAADNSALTCDSATATYYPRGDHWPAVPPIESHPVVFRQQKDGAPGEAAADSLGAVYNAFNTWMSVKCPDELANVYILDGVDLPTELGGPLADYETCDRGDTYECPSGAACITANCNTDNCNLASAENIIYFVDADWTVIADSATVALTTNLYIPDTGYIVTSDMEFNAVDYQWRAGGIGCASGGAKCFDVETVALHEAGHFLGFNHVMCSDAVMFPQGTGTQENHALTSHEKTAICTIYPPRPATVATARYTGEQCYQNSECPTSPAHVCIKPVGMTSADAWGWCAKTCTTTAGCGTGFICTQQDGGSQKFCKPGPNKTGGSVAADPGGSGTALDICQACSAGDQCSSGVCINQGGTSDGICTQTCVNGELPSGGSASNACPQGLACVATDQGWYVCWPDDPVGCAAQFSRGKLNDTCYLENDTSTTQDDWFKACGADLVCFVFKQRCGGRQGACVTYCNATDRPCSAESGYTCCFGVDDAGTCLGTATDRPHGSCFDIRRPGESCVTAEQSMCGNGASCFHFGDPSRAKCFRTCNSSADQCRADVETCITYSDKCNNSSSMCCDSNVWDATTQECVPSDAIEYYDIGVRCTSASECDSGLCQGYQGENACSRPCNPVTGGGCPGDIDVNADGTLDGGFSCLLISGQGRCWLTHGPVDPPANADTTPADKGGGCCNATTLKSGDLFLAALVWVPLVVGWLKRRRRR